MPNDERRDAVAALSSAAVADACLRHGVSPWLAPGGIRPVFLGSTLAGPVRPVRHNGSVEVILAALDESLPGEVLVIDNGGRTDESCLGDLIALEAMAVGLAGIVIWGCHRDTRGLLAIGLPVFSLGSCPAGPRRPVDPEVRNAGPVQIGTVAVHRGDFIVADDDGAIVVERAASEAIFATATDIERVERGQAQGVAFGQTLRHQLQFHDYLASRQRDPTRTFRQHLHRLGAAIEA